MKKLRILSLCPFLYPLISNVDCISLKNDNKNDAFFMFYYLNSKFNILFCNDK